LPDPGKYPGSPQDKAVDGPSIYIPNPSLWQDPKLGQIFLELFSSKVKNKK